MVSNELRKAAELVYVNPEDLHSNEQSDRKSLEFYKTVTIIVLPKIIALERENEALKKQIDLHIELDGYKNDP